MGVHDERSTMELSANATLKLELSFMMDQLIESTYIPTLSSPRQACVDGHTVHGVVHEMNYTQSCEALECTIPLLPLCRDCSSTRLRLVPVVGATVLCRNNRNS